MTKVTTELGKVSITPKGPYNSDTPYEILDLVEHKGSSFLFLQNSKGIEPVGDNVVTMIVALKGESFKYEDFTASQLEKLRGPSGKPGKGLSIIAFYGTETLLRQNVPSPEAGNAYGVGVAVPYDIYIYDGDNDGWVNNGPLQGTKGEDGKSAYELWLQEGNEGTLNDFLQSLKGADGKDWKVIEIDHIPTSEDLTYMDGEIEKDYQIGCEIRFKEVSGDISFYKLHDITESGAVWKETGSGGVSLPGNIYLHGANYFNKSVKTIQGGILNE